MRTTPIVEALQTLRPGAQFSVRGEVVEWLDADLSEPTADELAAELQRQDQYRTQRAIVDEAQRRMDAFAATRGYDDMRSLVSYVGDPDTVFDAEGRAGLALRSATWAALRLIQEQVLAGTRPMPECFADIESELPQLVWPEL